MNQNENFTTPNEETKKVNNLLNICKQFLKEYFDVDDLTNIEIFNLRKSIEQSLKNNRETRSFDHVDLIHEPFTQFLLDYGINMNDIRKIKYKGNTVFDDKPLMEHIKRTLKKAREEAHKPYLD